MWAEFDTGTGVVVRLHKTVPATVSDGNDIVEFNNFINDPEDLLLDLNDINVLNKDTRTISSTPKQGINRINVIINKMQSDAVSEIGYILDLDFRLSMLELGL